MKRDEYLAIQEKINDQIYTLGNFVEQDLTSRNLNYWIQEGLLLSTRSDKSKWLRFNLIDYVWLKILSYMSEMKVTKQDKVEKIKACLATIRLSELTDITNWPIEETAIDDVPSRKAYNGLGNILTHCLSTKSSYFIQVFKNGMCKIIIDNKEIASTTPEPEATLHSETFFQIAIADILTDFVATMLVSSGGKYSMFMRVVTNAEGTLLEQLHNKIVIEVSIKVKGQKAQHWSMEELVNEESVNKEFANTLAHYLVKGNYQKITYKLYGGSTVWFSGKSILPTIKEI